MNICALWEHFSSNAILSLIGGLNCTIKERLFHVNQQIFNFCRLMLPDVYSKSSQTCKMEHFAKIVKSFLVKSSKALAISAKTLHPESLTGF